MRDCRKGQVDVLDGEALPGVGDVEVAGGGLDDGGVGELGGGVFEGAKELEVFAVAGDSEVQGGSSLCGVVEDEDDAAVAEGDGVQAGVVAGEIEEVDGGPGEATIEGVGDGATPPSGALKHFKNVARGKSQLLFSLQGGHSSAINCVQDSLTDPSLKADCVQQREIAEAIAAGLNGNNISTQMVQGMGNWFNRWAKASKFRISGNQDFPQAHSSY